MKLYDRVLLEVGILLMMQVMVHLHTFSLFFRHVCWTKHWMKESIFLKNKKKKKEIVILIAIRISWIWEFNLCLAN